MNHPALSRLYEKYSCLRECHASLEAALAALVAAFESGGKLLVCGNGGSAADSEHFVGELMKGFLLRRPLPDEERIALQEIGGARGAEVAAHLEGALPAIALTSHFSLTTAVANDCGRGDMAFAQQVYGLGKTGDVLLGISTSGNAGNVVNAFHVARLRGLTTILLTGRSGGALTPLADVAIRVPADHVVEIQELHLPVYHALALALEEHFFGGGQPAYTNDCD
jgi:D-sedoheptulose 7-phosphate isomerase